MDFDEESVQQGVPDDDDDDYLGITVSNVRITNSYLGTCVALCCTADTCTCAA